MLTTASYFGGALDCRWGEKEDLVWWSCCDGLVEPEWALLLELPDFSLLLVRFVQLLLLGGGEGDDGVMTKK